MPVNVVRNKGDEDKWEAAKKLARRSYPGKTGSSFYKVTMHIYQNEKRAGKTAHTNKSASGTELILYRGFLLEKARFEQLLNDALDKAGATTGPTRGFRVRPLGDSLASQRQLELQQYSKDIRPHVDRGVGRLPKSPAAKKPKLPPMPKSYRTVTGIVLR